MTKIYTKAGDGGSTILGSGEAVLKTDLRVEAYGTIDELSSLLGLAVTKCESHQDVQENLIWVQRRLFVIASLLAFPGQREFPGLNPISINDLDILEQSIDRFTVQLPPLEKFILPGGTRLGATLHLARSVCRRAERNVVALNWEDYPLGTHILPFLNRLSDYLFTAARFVNHCGGCGEVLAQEN